MRVSNLVCLRGSIHRLLGRTAGMFVCMAAVSNAQATIIEMVEVPTNWKLENYVSTGVTVWSSSSICNGHLGFPDNATVDDQNRFFALVLSAKLANRPVFVRYEDQSCYIQSFGMQTP